MVFSHLDGLKFFRNKVEDRVEADGRSHREARVCWLISYRVDVPRHGEIQLVRGKECFFRHQIRNKGASSRCEKVRYCTATI